jgi:hypothetical protein
VADDEIERTFSDIVEVGVCTEIGCAADSLLTINLRPSSPAFPNGEYLVRLTASGVAEQSCCFVVLGASTSPCATGPACDPPLLPLQPPQISVFFALPAGTLNVSVLRDNAVVAGAAFDPVVERFQPNGPLCPPVCYQAVHEMVIE